VEQPAVGPIVDAMVGALDGAGSGALAPYLDEDTLLHVPGGSGLAGEYQGRDAICGLLDRMRQASHGTLRFETVCTTAGPGGDVRLRGRIHGQRLERSLRLTARIEALVDGSTIREVWLACSDQPAWDEFWA
jgi:hypothetical protein